MTNRCCPYCGQDAERGKAMWRHFNNCHAAQSPIGKTPADYEFGWVELEKWTQVAHAWGRVPEQRRKAWLVQLALRGAL